MYSYVQQTERTEPKIMSVGRLGRRDYGLFATSPYFSYSLVTTFIFRASVLGLLKLHLLVSVADIHVVIRYAKPPKDNQQIICFCLLLLKISLLLQGSHQLPCDKTSTTDTGDLGIAPCHLLSSHAVELKKLLL